jgi:hypothetical protein
MTDEFDRASEREQADRDRALNNARAAAAAMPKGEPGECEGCGEYFARLVGGLCGFCRDRGTFNPHAPRRG